MTSVYVEKVMEIETGKPLYSCIRKYKTYFDKFYGIDLDQRDVAESLYFDSGNVVFKGYVDVNDNFAKAKVYEVVSRIKNAPYIKHVRRSEGDYRLLFPSTDVSIYRVVEIDEENYIAAVTTVDGHLTTLPIFDITEYYDSYEGFYDYHFVFREVEFTKQGDRLTIRRQGENPTSVKTPLTAFEYCLEFMDLDEQELFRCDYVLNTG